MPLHNFDFVTIVSGLPRSGTSMMMRMLERGQMGVLTDELRAPDDDNPNGYYEFEAVKRTREDATWLRDATGKAVKMVYRLLYDLPADRHYRVLFMKRQLEEVLASQRVMLRRHGVADSIRDEQMAALFRSDLQAFRSWLPNQSHITLIDVDYNAMQRDPHREVKRVNDFLGGWLDERAMVEVIDSSLYRNRKPAAVAS